MEDFGSIRWQLVLSLFGAWVIIGLILWKGIASYGKGAAIYDVLNFWIFLDTFHTPTHLSANFMYTVWHPLGHYVLLCFLSEIPVTNWDAQ